MSRRALACLGIVVTLLFGLFGQQALALCVSGDHRAVEVIGQAPGLQQDMVGDANLADVVHECADDQLPHLRRR